MSAEGGQADGSQADAAEDQEAVWTIAQDVFEDLDATGRQAALRKALRKADARDREALTSWASAFVPAWALKVVLFLLDPPAAHELAFKVVLSGLLHVGLVAALAYTLAGVHVEAPSQSVTTYGHRELLVELAGCALEVARVPGSTARLTDSSLECRWGPCEHISLRDTGGALVAQCLGPSERRGFQTLARLELGEDLDIRSSAVRVRSAARSSLLLGDARYGDRLSIQGASALVQIDSANVSHLDVLLGSGLVDIRDSEFVSASINVTSAAVSARLLLESSTRLRVRQTAAGGHLCLSDADGAPGLRAGDGGGLLAELGAPPGRSRLSVVSAGGPVFVARGVRPALRDDSNTLEVPGAAGRGAAAPFEIEEGFASWVSSMFANDRPLLRFRVLGPGLDDDLGGPDSRAEWFFSAQGDVNLWHPAAAFHLATAGLYAQTTARASFLLSSASCKAEAAHLSGFGAAEGIHAAVLRGMPQGVTRNFSHARLYLVEGPEAERESAASCVADGSVTSFGRESQALSQVTASPGRFRQARETAFVVLGFAWCGLFAAANCALLALGYRAERGKVVGARSRKVYALLRAFDAARRPKGDDRGAPPTPPCSALAAVAPTEPSRLLGAPGAGLQATSGSPVTGIEEVVVQAAPPAAPRAARPPLPGAQARPDVSSRAGQLTALGAPVMQAAPETPRAAHLGALGAPLEIEAAARIHRARALIEAEHPGGLSADWSLSPAALGVLGTPVMQGQASMKALGVPVLEGSSTLTPAAAQGERSAATEGAALPERLDEALAVGPPPSAGKQPGSAEPSPLTSTASPASPASPGNPPGLLAAAASPAASRRVSAGAPGEAAEDEDLQDLARRAVAQRFTFFTLLEVSVLKRLPGASESDGFPGALLSVVVLFILTLLLCMPMLLLASLVAENTVDQQAQCVFIDMVRGACSLPSSSALVAILLPPLLLLGYMPLYSALAFSLERMPIRSVCDFPVLHAAFWAVFLATAFCSLFCVGAFVAYAIIAASLNPYDFMPVLVAVVSVVGAGRRIHRSISRRRAELMLRLRRLASGVRATSRRVQDLQDDAVEEVMRQQGLSRPQIMLFTLWTVLGLAVLTAFIILGCSLFMDAGFEPVLISSLSVIASAIAVVDSGADFAPLDLLDPGLGLLDAAGDLAALAADAGASAAAGARDLAGVSDLDLRAIGSETGLA